MEFTLYEGDKYKKCCGNCEFYLGIDERNPKTYSNCNCTEKIIQYRTHSRWLKSYYPSDVSCKYFSFVPNIKYKTNNKEIISDVTELLNSYCKAEECSKYKFHNKRCKLRIKAEKVIAILKE